jgi:hypothetical protein
MIKITLSCSDVPLTSVPSAVNGVFNLQNANKPPILSCAASVSNDRKQRATIKWVPRAIPRMGELLPAPQSSCRCLAVHLRQFTCLRQRDSRVQTPSPPRVPRVRKNDARAQRRDDDATPAKKTGSSDEVENHKKKRDHHSPVPRLVRPCPQMTNRRETLPCTESRSVQNPPITGD